MIMMTLVLLKA